MLFWWSDYESATADILAAIEEANADQVIVMPNNSNIRIAAEAAASACEDVKVAVIPAVCSSRHLLQCLLLQMAFHLKLVER